MDEDDDFGFSDNDLDTLPANTLYQLEKTAILSTQQPSRGVAAAPDSEYGLEDGDEVINLDDEPRASVWIAEAQYEQYPGEHENNVYNNHGHYDGPMEIEEMPHRSQADPQSLLSRIKKLELEKARLNRELQNEKTRAMSKSGEADTLRRRYDTAARENDRRLQALQQAHSDAMSKQRAELDKMRREREQAQTTNKFLEHDLAREVDKSKHVKKNLRSGAAARSKSNISPSETPKRQQKSLPFRDGFDEDDMVMASPTKNRDKLKVSTPKQAGKRKRQVADQSPIPALQLSEPRGHPKLTHEISVSDDARATRTMLSNLGKNDFRYELLHRFVNHRCSTGDRVLEALAQYHFPSQPEKKLSSLVYDDLSACSIDPDVHSIAVKICHSLLNLWERCLNEQFYIPLRLVLEAFQFVLACEPSSTSISVTDRAVPVVTSTIDLVSEPITRLARSTKLFSLHFREVYTHIDVPDSLGVLYSIATSCITSSKAITAFWQGITLDFVMRLLHRFQPLEHIMLTLRILSTSALTSSLGPLTTEACAPGQQEQMEDNVIERLTWLLKETPEPLPRVDDPDRKPDSYTSERLLHLRVQVLSLLTNFSISENGSFRLMHHRVCVGRLIAFLDSCITSLYSSPLSSTQSSTIKCINVTMRLIYHLTTSHPDIDIKTKLGIIQGGSHKYLIALTRLAFSDRLVLEAGVDEDVINAAHDILDDGLSLEEGEGLVRVFSSGGST